MPSRHNLGRKKRREKAAANELKAARIRRKKKAIRLAKEEADSKTQA